MGIKIIWTWPAVDGLYQVHQYILNASKSVIIANRVVQQIQESADILSEHNQMYPLDIYRLNNALQGFYR